MIKSIKFFTALFLVTFILSVAAIGFAQDSRYAQANTVMDLVRQQANVYVEGDHLVIEFREYLYPYDINKRLAYARRVADADAVISGKARLIYYYNPGGKLVAKADPWRGVRLVEEMK